MTILPEPSPHNLYYHIHVLNLEKLLLKDSDTIRSDHSHYHRLFKREMYPQDIIDELLSYDIRLKIAYDTVQYLHYYSKKKDVKSFFQQISLEK